MARFSFRILLVCVLAAPVGGIALWSIGRTASDFADPCATWNYPTGEAVRVGPHDTCRQRAVHTESMARSIIRAAIVPGGVLLASVLAIAGVLRSRRRLMIAAGIGMLAETIVVFTIAPLTLIAGVGFLLLSRGVSTRTA